MNGADMKVVDEPDLVRKADNPAVISNSNVDAHRAFIARRQAALDTKTRLESLETRLEGLEGGINRILNLLNGGQHGQGQ